MGRMVLLLTVGLGIIFGLSVLQMNWSNVRSISNASELWEFTQARNIAKSGVEMAIMELSKDTSWLQGYQGRTVDAGILNVSVQPTQARYPFGPNLGVLSARLITSTGTVNGSPVTVHCVVRFSVTGGIPRVFNYALCSEGSLTLTGNSKVLDNNTPQKNANIHSNASVHVGGSVLVNGCASYTNAISAVNPYKLETTFIPNIPGENPPYYKTDRIDFPQFDPNQYESIATDKTYSDLTLSGNITLGTKQNPKIWFIRGNLTLSGSITGYGSFVVTGNINISGNVTINGMDATGNHLALYSGGSVNLNGNVTVNAQIFAKQNVNMNGDVTIRGSVASAGTITNTGNVTVHYRQVTPEITNPFWPKTYQRPVILSYLE